VSIVAAAIAPFTLTPFVSLYSYVFWLCPPIIIPSCFPGSDVMTRCRGAYRQQWCFQEVSE